MSILDLNKNKNVAVPEILRPSTIGSTGGQTTQAVLNPRTKAGIDPLPVLKAVNQTFPGILNRAKAIESAVKDRSLSPLAAYEKQHFDEFAKKNIAGVEEPLSTKGPDGKIIVNPKELEKLTSFVMGFIGGSGSTGGKIPDDAKRKAIDAVDPFLKRGVVPGDPKLTLKNVESRLGVKSVPETEKVIEKQTTKGIDTPFKSVGDLTEDFISQSERRLGRPVVLTAREKRIVSKGAPTVEKARQAAVLMNQGEYDDAAKNILELSVDEASQGHAMLESSLGDGKSGLSALTDDLKHAYQDWVNTRSLGRAEAYFNTPKLIEGLPDGIETIIGVQDGTIDSPKLRDFFDDRFKKLSNAGVILDYKQDYLPQLWNNSEDEINAVFGGQRKLSLKPSFTLPSVFESYAEGIKAGLTPKFTNIKDLVQWYSKRTQNALADANFFRYLVNNGLIQPAGKAPRYWVTINPDGFPLRQIYIGKSNTTYSGNFKAPPNLAGVINNYLVSKENGPLSKFANFAQFSKGIILSAGIPKTGINAHGINILTRNILASNNPVSGLLKGSYYLLNPAAAEKALRKIPEIALDGVKHGLTLSTEDYVLGEMAQGIFKKSVDKFLKAQDRIFADPLFNKILPALKTQYYAALKNDLIKELPEEEAARRAAEIANTIFGGINYDALARDKETRKLFRAIILAPDWAETTLKIGSGAAKGFTNKLFDRRYKAYRVFVRNLLLAYTAANVANLITSGHLMVDNEPGRTFEIEAGKYSDGSKRYIRPFGTAVDFVRLPSDMVSSVIKGDLSGPGRVIRNRLSPPLASFVSWMFNTDYLGRPMFGKDKYGREIPVKEQLGSAFNLTAGLVTPSQVSAAIDVATGKSPLELGVEQALELPFRPGYKPQKNKKKKTTIGGGGILSK